MTAFQRTDVPVEIDSVEKLYVWVSSLMQTLYPNSTAIEGVGEAVRTCSAAPFYITASDPPTWRFLIRGSIPLANAWQGGENQLWNYAQDIGDKAIPANFKS